MINNLFGSTSTTYFVESLIECMCVYVYVYWAYVLWVLCKCCLTLWLGLLGVSFICSTFVRGCDRFLVVARRIINNDKLLKSWTWKDWLVSNALALQYDTTSTNSTVGGVCVCVSLRSISELSYRVVNIFFRLNFTLLLSFASPIFYSPRSCFFPSFLAALLLL